MINSAPPPVGLVPLGTATGNVEIDASKGNLFTVTLGGAVVPQLKNLPPGCSVYIKATQDATGNRSFIFGTGAGIQTVASNAIDTTPNLLPNSVTWYELQGTSDNETTAEVIDVQSLSTEGKVCLVPNGTDDTTQILAVLAAHITACLGPIGATYKVDGRNTGTITWLDLEFMQAVRMNPVAGWAPAAGLADDSTNAFFRVAGTVTLGGFTSAETVQAAKGTRSLDGVTSTAGAAAGQYLRQSGTQGGGSDLQYRQIVKVASVFDGTHLTIDSPLCMWLGPFGQSGSNLPGALRQLTPASHVRVKYASGAAIDTLGRNIAVGIRVEDFDGRDPGAVGAISCGFKGFSRAGIFLSCVHNLSITDCKCEGGNNSLVEAWSAHDVTVINNVTDPRGDPCHAQGTPHPMFYFLEAPTDCFFDQNISNNRPGLFHVQGGIANRFGNNHCRNGRPEFRMQRDPLVGMAFAFGVAFDGDAGPLSRAEFGYDYELGTIVSTDAYSETSPSSELIGPFHFYIHDLVHLSAVRLVADNEGLNETSGAVPNAGITYYPAGGFCLQEWTGGYIESMKVRGAFFGGLVVTTGAAGSYVEHYDCIGALNTLSITNVLAFVFNCAGNGFMPLFGRVDTAGAVFFSEANFIASPDYLFKINELNMAGFGSWRNVMCATADAGSQNADYTQLVKLDRGVATDGVRAITTAAADDPCPLVVAVGNSNGLNGALKLVAIGGGPQSTLLTGPVLGGDLITAEGGANRRGKVNAAATITSLLGKTITAATTGAGTPVVGQVYMPA